MSNFFFEGFLPVKKVVQQFALLSVLPLGDAGDDVHQDFAVPLLVAELQVGVVMVYPVMDVLHQLLLQDVILPVQQCVLLLVAVNVAILLLVEVLGHVVADDDLLDIPIS